MDKKTVIFGISNFAIRVMMDMEKQFPDSVAAFCVDRCYIKETTIKNKPVVAFEDIADVYPRDKYNILICIGYSKMNNLYKDIFNRVQKMDYEIINFISNKCDFNGKLTGVGNIILGNAYVGYDVELRNGNRVLPNTVFTHDISVGDFNYFAASVAVAGFIKIGNNCFFGMNSTVQNRLEIADYTLIGGGAYISKSTEQNGVYVPQRTIKLDKDSMDML